MALSKRPSSAAQAIVFVSELLIHIPTNYPRTQFFLTSQGILFARGWSISNLKIEGFIEDA